MKKVLSLILLITGLGAAYLMGYIPFQSEVAEDSVDEETMTGISSSEVPLYLPLDPPFVVNFDHLGTLRYLQVSLEVMYHEQDLLDKVSDNMPAIRNALILLLSDQKYENLSTLAGKESLREEIKQAINNLILANESVADSGEIYITNFVMQ